MSLPKDKTTEIIKQWSDKIEYRKTLMAEGFKERLYKPNEELTKKCGCNDAYIPDEYDMCDHCLLVKYTHDLAHDAGGCCSCVETGYTDQQVALIIRRALGQTVVKLK